MTQSDNRGDITDRLLKDSVALYFRETRRISKLITAEEEVLLSKQIEKAHGRVIRILLEIEPFYNLVFRLATDRLIELGRIRSVVTYYRDHKTRDRRAAIEIARLQEVLTKLLAIGKAIRRAEQVHEKRESKSNRRLDALVLEFDLILREELHFRSEFIRNFIRNLENSSFVLSEARAADIMVRLRRAYNDFGEVLGKLVEANVRLVIAVARGYSRRNGKVEQLDLIQVGNIGLIQAAERFDWRRGNRFATFVLDRIQQSMCAEIAKNSRTIRLSRDTINNIQKLVAAVKRFRHKYGREPNLEELAKAIGWPLEKVEEHVALSQKPLSLDKKVIPEEDKPLYDFISDQQAISPIFWTESTLRQESLRLALNTDKLDDREKDVLILHFGLNDDIPRPLAEIGRIFDLTRERIRQIKNKAIQKLRRYLKKEQYD